DYANWQNRLLEEEKIEAIRDYWHSQFANDTTLPLLDLPTDHPRPTVKSFQGDCITFTLEHELTSRLRQVCAQQDITLFMVLLAVVHVLLYRYTRQDDIIIGSPIAGRNHWELENQVGFYVNTLALRNKVTGADSFADFLKQVKQTASDAYENQIYPFDRLVDELELERDTGRHPLFDVMVILQNMEQEEFKLENLSITPLDIPFNTSKFDLMFSFTEKNPGSDSPELHALIEYDCLLYEKDRILRLKDHFTRLAESIATDSKQSIDALEILTEEEKRLVLETFNDTDVDYSNKKSLVSLFEDRVENSPDRIALTGIDPEHYLTYNQLNHRTNLLAHRLKKEGIIPGSIVAIMAERSMETVIGFLGILKAGGVYLPIDPGYPEERIRYMLRDSGAKIIVTNSARSGQGRTLRSSYLPNIHRNVLRRGETLCSPCSLLSKTPKLELPTDKPTNPVYLIYTSGTTGKPKAVIGTFRCLTNLIHWQMETFKSDETGGFRSILYNSLNFDVSIQEILFSVCTGGALYLIPDTLKRDPDQLAAFMRSNHIQLITLPFSALNLLFHKPGMLEDITSLKHIITSGEQLQITENIKHFLDRHPDVSLHNQYGPSETHVVTSYTLSGGQEIIDPMTPIGKPVSNTACFILDHAFNPVPI
ncbi:MAG: AMP-binding protein, partial [bacterium]|nr:AMP-binding protein [bacterium]